ncbi:DUF2846 domain-containing protein [Psychrobium sp. 1_MG-2023]|uniref:DUF2846 domain-containing protein n=1 Tax=Psychrobium sp. 1_MG-2023 TaxID=3062624 RepID=UPI00351E0196
MIRLSRLVRHPTTIHFSINDSDPIDKGGAEHKLSTESEFSPNDLLVKTESGKNYFVSQYIKMGVFVGGAGLELVDEGKGQKEVSKLDMAKKGKCSS